MDTELLFYGSSWTASLVHTWRGQNAWRQVFEHSKTLPLYRLRVLVGAEWLPFKALSIHMVTTH